MEVGADRNGSENGTGNEQAESNGNNNNNNTGGNEFLFKKNKKLVFTN